MLRELVKSVVTLPLRAARRGIGVVLARRRPEPPPAEAPRAAPTPPPAPRGPSPRDVQIDPESLFERRKAGAALVFVDVREAYERSRWIEGDRHVPIAQLESVLGELPKDVDVILYCASGNRSTQGALMMRERGFPQAWSLVGGFGHWERDGGEVASKAG